MRALCSRTLQVPNSLWRVLPLLAAGVILALGLATVFNAGGATAASVEPVLVSNNPTCADVGYGYGFKIDPPKTGTFQLVNSNGTELIGGAPPDTNNSVTISNFTLDEGDVISFDWSSTLGIDAVIVKGGPNANVYHYSPEATSDSGLNAPVNPNNQKFFGISHITFCYDYELSPLTVTKTVEASFKRTWNWEITKTVDPDTHNLLDTQTGTSNYTVTVTKSGPVDSNYKVWGKITIYNPNNESVKVTGISDSVDGVPATITGCSTPFSIPAKSSRECNYTATTGLDGDETKNTVTVTTEDPDLSGSYTANFQYAIHEINPSVTVTDTNPEFGGNKTVSNSETFQYSIDFTCENVEYNEDGTATYTHPNTATIVETEQSADANVTVNCKKFDPLSVEKTAVATFDQDYDWEIDKSVDPDSWVLAAGESGTSTYTVTATRTGPFNSGYEVSGTITIVNQNPEPVQVLSVVDTIMPGNIAANVECGVMFPHTLAAYDGSAGGDDTLECTYSATESDGLDGDEERNTVRVRTEQGVADGSHTVRFSYVVDQVTDESLTVDDTNGMSWTFNGSGQETYDVTFTCDADEGEHENTITADAGDQGELTDSATVTVECTEEEPGTITIRKQANPDDTPWSFHFDGPGNLTTTLLSGQSSSETLEAGSYTISEDLDELVGDTSGDLAWELVDITCESTTGDSSFVYNVAGGSVTVDLAPGDDVDCTFVNEAQPGVVIPEVPFAALLPVAALLVAAGGYLFWRRRERLGQAS